MDAKLIENKELINHQIHLRDSQIDAIERKARREKRIRTSEESNLIRLFEDEIHRLSIRSHVLSGR